MSRTKDISDRIRERLRTDPKARERVLATVADICECGGSYRHNEHAGGCTRFAEPQPARHVVEFELAGVTHMLTMDEALRAHERLRDAIDDARMVLPRCEQTCDHGSRCTLPAGHAPADRHETEHGCVCYDGPAAAEET